MSPAPVPIDDRGLPANYHFQPDWEVTPRQVKARLDASDDLILIDCRTAPEYKIARIEGAKLFPLQQMAAAIDALKDDADRSIIVHCHHGVRSLKMAAALRQHGFCDVKSMAGGIEIWSRDIDPTVPRY